MTEQEFWVRAFIARDTTNVEWAAEYADKAADAYRRRFCIKEGRGYRLETIDQLTLSVTARNVLGRLGISTIGELEDFPISELQGAKDCDESIMKEIENMFYSVKRAAMSREAIRKEMAKSEEGE